MAVVKINTMVVCKDTMTYANHPGYTRLMFKKFCRISLCFVDFYRTQRITMGYESFIAQGNTLVSPEVKGTVCPGNQEL